MVRDNQLQEELSRLDQRREELVSQIAVREQLNDTQKLAIELHSMLCRDDHNHGRECAWNEEPENTSSSWGSDGNTRRSVHGKYFNKAQQMLHIYPNNSEKILQILSIACS